MPVCSKTEENKREENNKYKTGVRSVYIISLYFVRIIIQVCPHTKTSKKTEKKVKNKNTTHSLANSSMSPHSSSSIDH